MKDKVLVTGAVGFIGTNLVEKLLNDGYFVYGMDVEKNRSYYNKRFEDRDFKMIWSDVCDIFDYDQLKDIKRIYHLAASADIAKCEDEPFNDLYNNIYGTQAVLEFMKRNDIEEIVFSSSSAVYGEGPTPMKEDMRDMRPISYYGASKLGAEAYIHTYANNHGIKASIFRFANVVGPWEHRGVIPDFIKKLRENNNELYILGDGTQRKSFFHVSDCIKALTNIPVTNPASIYNLGANDTILVKEIADIVCEEMRLKDVEYKYSGGDRGWVGDVPKTIMDISKANKEHWFPETNSEESVRETVRWLTHA